MPEYRMHSKCVRLKCCLCLNVQVRASLRGFTVEAVAERDTSAGRESARLRAKAMASLAVLRAEKEVCVCVLLFVCVCVRLYRLCVRRRRCVWFVCVCALC